MGWRRWLPSIPMGSRLDGTCEHLAETFLGVGSLMPWSWDGIEWDDEELYPCRRVFVAFQASSPDDASGPIDVGYVEEQGIGTGSLIRPEPGWTDWSMGSQAVHGISRLELQERGKPAYAWGRHLVAATRRHRSPTVACLICCS